MFTKFLIALILVTGGLLLGTHTIFAATIYSNYTSGNDTTGNGTSGTPYKTFQKAYGASSNGDIINLTGTFDWTNADETGDATTNGYVLSKNITIMGQGAAATFAQAASSAGTANRRVFTVSLGNTVTIQNLGIRYGYSSSDGGGIRVLGSLVLNGADVFSNQTTNGGGGGVSVAGSAVIENSTIRNNSAYNYGGGLTRGYYSGSGGAPGVSDTLDVINSTVSGNTVTATTAYLDGGGIYFRRGSGSITNSTITNNSVIHGNSSISTQGVGAGDLNSTILLKNDIIAGNTSLLRDGDLGFRSTSNGTFVDNGGNIIGRLGYFSSFTTAATTWVDAITYNIPTNGTYVLQDGTGSTSGSLYLNTILAANSSVNGTLTHAITNAASIAINNGVSGTNGSISVPTTDQRSVARGSTPDIGSYEFVSDIIPPVVSYLNPSNGATNVGVTANYEIAFNENVATSTGNIVLKKTSDNSTVETIDITSSKVTASSTSAFMVNPSTTLASNTGYYFTVDAAAIKDIAGNNYAGIATSTTWSFTTADVINPVVSTVSPTDNATSVPINSNFVVTFSENVATSTGNIIIKKTSDGSVVESFNVADSPLITGSGAVYTVNPTNDLSYATNYYLQIDPTAFNDMSGNGYAGITNATDWNFTTVAAPVTITAANGPIYTGTAAGLPGYTIPRMQIVHSDGTIVYLDVIKKARKTKDRQISQEEKIVPIVIAKTTFPYDLQIGTTNAYVWKLQKFLNTQGFILAAKGNGAPGNETNYFGPRTHKELVLYQEAHAKDILLPLGMTVGTGFFGPSTRAFIDSQQE